MPTAPKLYQRRSAPGGSVQRDHVARRKQASDQRRDREVRGLYGRKWAALSQRLRRQYPGCSLCFEQGRAVKADVVDHWVSHKGDINLFWDAGNHVCLCKPCHDGTKRRLELGFQRFGKMRSKPKAVTLKMFVELLNAGHSKQAVGPEKRGKTR